MRPTYLGAIAAIAAASCLLAANPALHAAAPTEGQVSKKTDAVKPAADTARGSGGVKPTEAKPELMVLVYERKGCGYCRLVRENIIPAYWRAPEADRLPMRIIDIDALGTAGHVLKEPIDTTPTFVFLRDGAEVHRITGYPGRENFFAVVDWILKQPANSSLSDAPKITLQIPQDR